MITNFMEEDNNSKYGLKIYLAGPDVFRKDALKRFALLKKYATKYGHEGLAPFDNTIDNISQEELNTPIHSMEIFAQNVKLIDKCDIIIANIEPFRGAGVDDGTAFELGYGFAAGKTMYGYSTLSKLPLRKITEIMFDLNKQPKFQEIENFGHSVNLMIAHSIEASGGKIFSTFEQCLIDLNRQLENPKLRKIEIKEAIKKKLKDIEEATDAGSTGSFEGPAASSPIKRKYLQGTDFSKILKYKKLNKPYGVVSMVERIKEEIEKNGKK